MTEFKIEKEVPIPKETRRGPIYPFVDMGINDSFSFAINKILSVRSAASYYGIRHGKKFKVMKHNGEGRCWRTA